jgi:hypothetical protein
LRIPVSELINSGLFFGETTFHKSFLLSGQECLQDFSASFDVCLAGKQQLSCVSNIITRLTSARATEQNLSAFFHPEILSVRIAELHQRIGVLSYRRHWNDIQSPGR